MNSLQRCLLMLALVVDCGALASQPSLSQRAGRFSGPLDLIENPHPIEGYADAVSVLPGATLEVKVHSPNGRFNIDFSRYGAFGVPQLLLTVTDLEGGPQDYDEDAYRNGAGWSTSYFLEIPPEWSSGLYNARLYDGAGSFNLNFIVKSAPGDEAAIALLSSTNTWQAYNDWGGASFYRCNISHCSGGTYSTLVTLDRPNPGASASMHLVAGERFILGWLEANNYSYSMLSDSDLHSDPDALQPFSTAILSTHTEYWSREMYDALQRFHDRAGNILYLSGNGIYWKVTFAGRQMEVRKDGGIHEQTGERGGLWRALGLPEAALLGVRYDGRQYPSCGPYAVLPGYASDWIFAGTGLQDGDFFGCFGLNTATCASGAASGWEMDGVDAVYRPPGLRVVAEGLVNDGAGADMTYYELSDLPPHGGVFSVGSITFGGSLAVDPDVSQIVANVLAHYGN